VTEFEDPRHTTAGLLHILSDGKWRTRAELRAIAGPGWPLLLRALEVDRHGLSYERSKVDPNTWFRVRLIYEAASAPAVDESEQLALAVRGTAPPGSALIGPEDAR
jgi:hypothetical protein